jgi:Na+-driven multidrug efflux pump
MDNPTVYCGHSKKLDVLYDYAIKSGIIIEIIFGTIIFILAPNITHLFTWSDRSAVLYDDIVHFVRIMCFFYPAAVLGIFSGSIFQGVGKGIYAFIITLFRTIILVVPLAWIFGIIMNGNLTGVWFGILAGTWIGVLIAYGWVKVYIAKLIAA